MAILECETSAQIGEGLTCMGIVRSGHFWQLGSIACEYKAGEGVPSNVDWLGRK